MTLSSFLLTVLVALAIFKWSTRPQYKHQMLEIIDRMPHNGKNLPLPVTHTHAHIHGNSKYIHTVYEYIPHISTMHHMYICEHTHIFIWFAHMASHIFYTNIWLLPVSSSAKATMDFSPAGFHHCDCWM